MEILKFGTGERVEVCRSALESRLYGVETGFLRLIILPIPTTRDKIHISNTDIELFALTDYIESGTFLAGYGIPTDLKREAIRRGAAIYDGAEDEEFLLENARITAHGVLGRILTETGRDIRELTVGIIGYGRIGSALAELLLFLGAGVRIYSKNKNKLCMLAEAGAMAEEICEEVDFSDLNILINTAPKEFLTRKKVSAILDGGTKIIELASGNNFSDERVVRMPSVPDRMYPLSAGRLYANSIAKAMRRIKNRG